MIDETSQELISVCVDSFFKCNAVRYGDRFNHGFSIKKGNDAEDSFEDEGLPLMQPMDNEMDHVTEHNNVRQPENLALSGSCTDDASIIIDDDEVSIQNTHTRQPILKDQIRRSHYQSTFNLDEQGRKLSSNVKYRLFVALNNITWVAFTLMLCMTFCLLAVWSLFIILGAFVFPSKLISWVVAVLGYYTYLFSLYRHYKVQSHVLVPLTFFWKCYQ